MKIDSNKLPEKSDIAIEKNRNEITIILPYRKGNSNDIFCNGINVIGSVIVLILGANVISTINHSANISNDEWFWLILFLLMGVVILWQLYITFRKTTYEQIILKPEELFFDSGISPLYCNEKKDILMRYNYTTHYQKTFFIQELTSLVLTKTKDDSLYLLTFEKSEKVIFFGFRMTDEERKWLYRTILNYYGLEYLYKVIQMDESKPKKKKLFILAWIVVLFTLPYIIKWISNFYNFISS